MFFRDTNITTFGDSLTDSKEFYIRDQEIWPPNTSRKTPTTTLTLLLGLSFLTCDIKKPCPTLRVCSAEKRDGNYYINVKALCVLNLLTIKST